MTELATQLYGNMVPASIVNAFILCRKVMHFEKHFSTFLYIHGVKSIFLMMTNFIDFKKNILFNRISLKLKKNLDKTLFVIH